MDNCQTCKGLRSEYARAINAEARCYARILAHKEAHKEASNQNRAAGEEEGGGYPLRDLQLLAEDDGWSEQRAAEALEQISRDGH